MARLRSPWLSGLSPAFLLVLAACQENEPHPPMAPLCNPGEVCKAGNDGTSSTPPQGGSTGAGGSTGGAAWRSRSGNVVDLVDDSFNLGIQYGDAALVEAEGIVKPLVSARWNGVEPFKIENFREASTTWVSVRPEVQSLHLRTLHPISLDQSDPLELGLARSDAIDFIFSGFTTPALREPGHGQVVITFFEGTPPKPLAGVQVAASIATFVAYRFGGSWTLDADRTDASGLVLLGNIVGSPFPGTDIRVSLTLAGMPKGFATFRVASDAVTIGAIPILP